MEAAHIVSPADLSPNYLATHAVLVDALAADGDAEVDITLTISGDRKFPSVGEFILVIGAGNSKEAVLVKTRKSGDVFTIDRDAFAATPGTYVAHAAGDLVRMVSVSSITYELQKGFSSLVKMFQSGLVQNYSILPTGDRFSVVANSTPDGYVKVKAGVAVLGNTILDFQGEDFQFALSYAGMTADHYRQALVYIDAADGEVKATYGTSNASAGSVGTAADPSGTFIALARVVIQEGDETIATGDITDARPVYGDVIDLASGRVWDALMTNAVATAAADDLAVVGGTFLTDAPVVQSGDSKAASTTRKIRYTYVVPNNYVAGRALTLRLVCGMKTTISDTSATVDAQVARSAAPTVDICATAAQAMNALSSANKDFVLTPTNVVPGDVLNIVLTVAIVDSATGTAVIGEIREAKVLFG